MEPEILMAVSTAKSVTLDRISSGGRPQWTLSEVGLACGGLPQHVFDAALFTYAGDDSVRQRLSVWLLEWALKEREERKWPRRVVTSCGPRQFMSDLCDLWLCEVRSPWRFERSANQPNIRRVVMDVSEPVWSARLAPIYAALGSEFIQWLDEAGECIERRTRKW